MDQGKLMLYSPYFSSRLRYIAGHLAVEMMGAGLLMTDDISHALSSGLPVVNYSSSRVPGAVNIIPHGLLGETGVRTPDANPVMLDGQLVLFPSDGSDDTGFDVFAASFYMLSRYEEYLPFRKDMHGRFPYGESMAFRHSVAGEPLVDLWAGRLRDAVTRKYPSFSFPVREFSFIPTIDVDIPWAYRNRGVWRTAGGVARSLLRGDREDTGLRFQVLNGTRQDPYDTFSLIERLHKDHGVSPLFFFPAGTYGKYDKCASPSNPAYRKLAGDLSDRYDWGIHPSYLSFDDTSLLHKEIEIIAGITGARPVRSRQHFLRLEFPATYRVLAGTGIYEDYTTGWAEMTGFRAGTCTPFFFYDLERDEPSALKIFPFQIMDGTLCDYMKLSPEQAVFQALRIVKKVRDAGGTLITLWHNESLSGSGKWKNWENVYIEILRAATQ